MLTSANLIAIRMGNHLPVFRVGARNNHFDNHLRCIWLRNGGVYEFGTDARVYNDFLHNGECMKCRLLYTDK